ncbi:ferrous iron transport protein B [Ruminococcaceae bacterium OttesenSCG-928-I18]|nr:ferrous iron transport protein B [Ruminococcaceae bacterium OttesenSCG-928-I18]
MGGSDRGCSLALAGNPNCGKTTMFNDLTGASQRVGNWPGVTVEKKEGKLRGAPNVRIADLPGTYSLSPYSPEEVVSRDYLLSGQCGAILNIVDGTGLERNLYLTSQLLEVGLPVVVALNMADILHKKGEVVDVETLSKKLGCPVVPTSALKGEGTAEAARLAADMVREGKVSEPAIRFSPDVEEGLSAIAELIEGRVKPENTRWYAIKLFERDEDALDKVGLSDAEQAKVQAIVETLEKAYEDDAESIITGERYAAICDIIGSCVQKKASGLTTSDKIDRIVTNRFLALPIFAAVMVIVYYVSIMSVGDVVTGWTNDVLFGEWIGGGVQGLMEGAGAAAWLTSLVVDGIIGGVGAVLGFLPQMIILFIFLTFLEDCGYMARVAFMMDRIFRRFGLSGKSFIPMLISSGCGVPGIMATKTIENEKDRRMTVITTTFIPCGAKLPIIALIGGALLGGAWWVAPVIYFAGVGAVIVTGIMLKKTRLFAGEASPFVMELPQYHLPGLKTMALHVWERVRSFVIKAGTIIFISSVVIWFLLSFGVEGGGFAMVGDVANSFMAKLGGLLAPLFAPLGFGNWEASVGVIAGLVAKENLVSTLAIIQGLSDGAVEGILDDSSPLWAYIGLIIPGALAGMSFLLFNMLCAPCFAAIGAIRRQMNSAKWTLFAVAYQCVFAYCISLMVYQLGTFFTGGGFTVGTLAALLVLALFLFLLFRPARDPQAKMRRAAAKI